MEQGDLRNLSPSSPPPCFIPQETRVWLASALHAAEAQKNQAELRDVDRGAGRGQSGVWKGRLPTAMPAPVRPQGMTAGNSC